MKCHRCNQFGHYKNECHLKKFGLWYCYVCVEHKGNDCPNKTQRFESTQNKKIIQIRVKIEVKSQIHSEAKLEADIRIETTSLNLTTKIRNRINQLPK